MYLSSTAFKDGQLIPSLYTCDGENLPPPLSISQVPRESQTLALMVDDPDSPSGEFCHWLVWNLPPSLTHLSTNLPSQAVQGLNDFGFETYGGPCPPSGTHAYRFCLYALNFHLDLPSHTLKAEFLKEIKPYVIATSYLTGLYHRL